jgi:hypothetical protein
MRDLGDSDGGIESDGMDEVMVIGDDGGVESDGMDEVMVMGDDGGFFLSSSGMGMIPGVQTMTGLVVVGSVPLVAIDPASFITHGSTKRESRDH